MTVIDFVISKDWRIKKWGDGMESRSNYRDAEVLGRNVMDLFTEDVHDILTEKLQQAADGQTSQYFRIPFYTKAADELDVFMYTHREETTAADDDDDAEIVVRGGVIPSTNQSPFCCNTMTIGIDSEGNVTTWDEQAEALTGMQCQVVRGQNFLQYFMTEDFRAKDFMAEKIKRTMAGEHVGKFMVPIFTLAAELKIVELSASRTSGGGVVLTSGPAVSKASTEEMSRKFAEERTGDTLPTSCPSSELPNLKTFTSSDLPVLTSDK